MPAGEASLSFSQRMQEVREGFQRAFWVANITELFERLAYYGQQAVLAIYLHEQLHLSVEQTGRLLGFFGFVVWFLPILGGTLADRFGFKRSLAFAYLVLSLGYFLLGSLSASWMAPVRNSFPLYWLVFVVLMIPALGPSIVKPVVVGTTARASSENVRSLGYSIYYTLVNVGGTLGPLVAFIVRRSIGIENVFRVCALSVFLMFFGTLLFYREPTLSGERQVASVGLAFKNMIVVLGNFRFILFLVIFSGFWIVFWQEFISLPLYLRGYINANADVDLLLTIDPLTVILLTIVVSYLTRKVPVFPAMTAGILITSVSWLFLALGNPAWQVRGLPVWAGIALVVLALGEITQSPRYYEYVSRLAPPGQQGTFMGYSFLPIAIGYFIAGPLGGYLLHHFGEELHRPHQMWYVVSAVGVGTTILMWIYNRVVRPAETRSSPK